MEDNGVRNEEDSTSKQVHVKYSYSSNGKQTAERTSDFIKFYVVLELFEANSGLFQKFYRL